jgi:hypothetical protein
VIFAVEVIFAVRLSDNSRFIYLLLHSLEDAFFDSNPAGTAGELTYTNIYINMAIRAKAS